MSWSWWSSPSEFHLVVETAVTTEIAAQLRDVFKRAEETGMDSEELVVRIATGGTAWRRTGSSET